MKEKFKEIDTKKERFVCYILLALVLLIIASGLSTLFIAFNLGIFIIENVSDESLQAINRVIRLKYDLIQQAGGLEHYIKVRTAILAGIIATSGGLLFYLHIRLMRILTNYDKLRSTVAHLVNDNREK